MPFPEKRTRNVLLASALWLAPLAILAGARSVRGRAADPSAAASGAKTEEPLRGDREIRSTSSAAIASRLLSLPYILQSYDPRHALSGVVLHKKDFSAPGLNFFFPWTRTAGKAYLMNRDGRILWRWSLENYEKTRPHRFLADVELLPDGSILLGHLGRAVVKLDRDSKVVWELSTRAHHDLSIAPDGTIWGLTRSRALVPQIHPKIPILSDAIIAVSPEGKLLRTIPVVDLILRSGYGFLLPRLQGRDLRRRDALDVFHCNHVEVLDGRSASRSPIFRKGNVLLSIRNMNVIAIMDAETEKLVWLWGPGNLTYQHYPRMLGNGHVLIFDNGIDASQILEVDPLTQSVEWRYSPREGFFSAVCGAAERLPNGNTLITESMKGYAFEVTPGGEIVWKYANPEVGPTGVRNGIVQMTLVDPAALRFLPGEQVASR